MMVLVDDQDRVLLLWRHRFVQDRWGWELPGRLIDEGEESSETAARELEKQTGYQAGRVEHLIRQNSAVGAAPKVLESSPRCPDCSRSLRLRRARQPGLIYGSASACS